MLFRCIIKLKFKNFYIGKTYNKKWYLIINNSHSSYFKKGADYNFYAKKSKSVILDKLLPISDEEAYTLTS